MTAVEEFLPLPMPRERVPPVTQIRTTLLTASVHALQTRGDFERYLTALPAAYHETMTQMVAATWVPYAVADAHYRACNSLGYGATEYAEIGKDVGNRIHATILSTLVKLAKGAGVTPWTSFAQFRRLWERIYVGGAVAVWKIGPKEARVDVVNVGLVAIPYYHAAQRALFTGLLELFCNKAYAFDVPQSTTATGTTYRFAWA